MERYIRRQLIAVSVSIAGFMLLISAVGVDFVLGRHKLAALMAFTGVGAMAWGVADYRRVVMSRLHRRRDTRQDQREPPTA